MDVKSRQHGEHGVGDRSLQEERDRHHRKHRKNHDSVPLPGSRVSQLEKLLDGKAARLWSDCDSGFDGFGQQWEGLAETKHFRFFEAKLNKEGKSTNCAFVRLLRLKLR